MKWVRRLAASLAVAGVLTGIFWLAIVLFVWLDSIVPAEAMGIVGLAIFVAALIGDWIYDTVRQQ